MFTTLRLLQLIAMTVWVGGLIFFAFILAPTAFGVLPTQHEAGLVVGGTLKLFDLVALASGVIFLGATAGLFRTASMRVRGPYEVEFLLAALMIVGTVWTHFRIEPAMDADRLHASGDINTLAPADPSRVHFDQLHKQSEHVEGAVLLVGLFVLFLLAREQPSLE